MSIVHSGKRTFSSRREFLESAAALALGAALPGAADAATTVPLADAHSHTGLLAQKLDAAEVRKQMQAAGLMLMAWNIVGDLKWLQGTGSRVEQTATPGPGEAAAYFLDKLSVMRARLDKARLPFVRTVADIESARSGTPHVVIAVEGAAFADEQPELLPKAHEQGLRQLQLIHFMKSALGDRQTERPEYGGLSARGKHVVRECNRLGILVDLAHGTNDVIDQALEISSAPAVWSHSLITHAQYSWQNAKARQLNIDYARKIAHRGGAIGLWAIKGTLGGSVDDYAGELMRMVDEVGPEHVMFGSDIGGGGSYGAVQIIPDLRKVVEVLAKRGVDDQTLSAICFDNYARCLATALKGRAG